MSMEEKRIYPVLPLRNVVVFPHTVLPIFVGRRKSLALLKRQLKKINFLFLLLKK